MQKAHASKASKLKEETHTATFASIRIETVERGQACCVLADPEWVDVAKRDSKLSPHITLPMDALARGFFLTHYVLAHSRSLVYLQSFCQADMDEHLVLSLNAVALASFASKSQSAELENQAKSRYGAALHSVNHAIQRPDVAKKDSTLLAVMLLDLFEKITSRRHQSSLIRPKPWTEHIQGATALLRLRGCQQFQSRNGLGMFIQLSSAITVACMQLEIPVPAEILDLRADAAEFLDVNTLPWRVSEFRVRFVNLQAALGDGTLSDHATIINTAAEIDEGFRLLLSDMFSKWPYETIYTKYNSALFFETRYHLHSDRRTASAWNALRTGRILLNNIIFDQYTKSLSTSRCPFRSAEHKARFQHAIDTITLISSDICATVPPYASSLPQAVQTPPSAPAAAKSSSPPSTSAPPIFKAEHSSSATPPPPPSRPKSLSSTTSLETQAAFSMIWPLFVVSQSPVCADATHTWIVSCLRSISHTFRIPQARLVAEILSRSDDDGSSGDAATIWSVHAMLDSYEYPHDRSDHVYEAAMMLRNE